ncbi:MAG: PorT family protein [Chitinophagaceae bacterium]|nr:MAG: PorT family protein [Chitinophagaceae bacterium]
MNYYLIFITGLLFLVFGANANASKMDTDQREVFAFGIKAGFNYSNVWDSRGQEFDADPKFGFAGGFFAGIPLGRTIGLQPEILISQKGFKGSGTILTAPYTIKRTKTYIDIPLQLQIKPVQHVTFLVGPQFSYLLKQDDVYTFGSNSILVEEEFKNDNIRKNILGFTAGIDFSISHFVLSGKYGWDFQNNNGDGTSSTPRYKNRWLQLTAGYIF